MLNLRRIGLFSMPLRAAFTLVFFIFATTQPSMLAAAGVQGVVHGAAMQAIESAATAHDSGGHQHPGSHSHADQADQSAHDGSSSGKSCEVHCAPAHAMPVECPEIAPSPTRCFVAIVSEPLPPGEYAVHIRPPRRLT